MFLNAKNKTRMKEKQIILEYRYWNNFQFLWNGSMLSFTNQLDNTLKI